MSVRDDIVSHALWGADNERDIHYSMVHDRFSALHHPRMLPMTADCSSFYTDICAWSGAPDPNGLGYNGTGYTGTILDYLPDIDIRDALIGDPIVYGPSNGDHIVVIVADAGTSNPLTVSHGQERGPIQVRHSIEVAAHRSPARALRLLGVDMQQPPLPLPQPPPEADVDKFTYFYRDGGGPIFALFDVGQIRGVKYFDDFEEVFVRQMGCRLNERQDGDDITDDKNVKRRVWRLEAPFYDALISGT